MEKILLWKIDIWLQYGSSLPHWLHWASNGRLLLNHKMEDHKEDDKYGVFLKEAMYKTGVIQM